jgi:hypothetical protein
MTKCISQKPKQVSYLRGKHQWHHQLLRVRSRISTAPSNEVCTRTQLVPMSRGQLSKQSMSQEWATEAKVGKAASSGTGGGLGWGGGAKPGEQTNRDRALQKHLAMTAHSEQGPGGRGDMREERLWTSATTNKTDLTAGIVQESPISHHLDFLSTHFVCLKKYTIVNVSQNLQ